jgi:hypothetical protein
MKKLIIYFLLLLALPTGLSAQITKTIGKTGSGANYSRLKLAFDAINGGILQGNVILQIIDNTTESQSAVLHESGYNGTANYSSVTIYPTVTGKTISGNLNGALIELHGADNVTFDGRLNHAGSTDLIITNTYAGALATTIRFIDDDTTNLVEYCTIKGSGTNAASGVLFFSTTTGTTGNDNNTIDNNNITTSGANRPINAIYSLGTSTKDNSGNIISNNNFYDFLNKGTASNGIFLSSYTTTWTISGNSFYETASFTPTADVAYNAIQIDNTSGTGFTITGNSIGGSAASCGSTAWIKTIDFDNAFNAISLNVGTGTVSSVQNNTIKNFDWSNLLSSSWTGILILGGDVNVGTSSGNTIGSGTGTGSITITNAQSGSFSYGINILGSGIVDCQNNVIGSVTTANDNLNANDFYGINKDAVSGTTTISYNTIGSTSTANSIYASSNSTDDVQSVVGILNAGTGIITINSNIIANLTNNTLSTEPSNAGLVKGIGSSGGTLTVDNNTIHDLTISNSNDAVNQSCSISGIALVGNLAAKTISRNTIYNLSNTYSSFTGSVIGLYFNGNTGANAVRENFIHSLSVTGASSTTASIYGIKIFAGATTYSNNIISLGGTSKTTIYGIYETGAANNNNSLYFNTVYIGGDGNGGTNKSYALYSAVTTNTRNFRNNIFVNARSTTAGSNLHYAVYIVSTGGSIICDYNDYLASGTYGSILGYYGAYKTVLPIVTGQDISSFAISPGMANPGGTASTDYLPSTSTLVSVTGTGITTDYDGGAARSTTYPSMGAFEYTVTPTTWTFTGSSTSDWNTTANWNYNTLPPTSSGTAIIIPVTNNPVINEAPATPAECQNLTINSGGVLTIAAGKAFKVNGTITNIAGISGLVIKSDANGNDGKLLYNTSSVAGTVELYLAGGAGGSGPAFHYIIPPVASMSIGSTIASVKTNLGLISFNGDLMNYSEVAAGSDKNAGWKYFDNYPAFGTPNFTSITSAEGYNIYLTAADKITFSGTLNCVAHSFNPLSFTNLGWNLVGNPYPCNYDLTGISALVNTGDNVDNTVYFNHDGGYAYWNVDLDAGTTGFSAIMPPMQGFFVIARATGTSLSLPVTSKTSTTAAPLRSKGLSLVKKIKLVLNNGAVPDETIVCLVDKATSGFDGDYDAYKLFGTGTATPSIYTELNSIKYAINSIQEPGSSTVIVPVTVVLKTSGTYKIDITEFENIGDLPVFLKHGAVVTNLSKNASYTFTSAAGTFTDFQLVFGNIVTTVEKLTRENLKTWYSNNYLYINCPDVISSDKGKIVIYDIQGKLVYTNNLIYLVPGQTIQLPLNLESGIYITHVIVNNQPYISKIVIL